MDCLVKTYQAEGVRGLYKGSVPRLARVVLDAACTFTLFGQINKVIQKALN